MIKAEFLHMMEQDLETNQNKTQLLDVLGCIKEILKSYSADTEIDPAKTVEDCFKQMKEHARKNQAAGSFYFSHIASIEFITKYLGLGKPAQASLIDLDDFLA